MSDFMRLTFTKPPPPQAGNAAWKLGAAQWAYVTRPLVRNALKSKAPIGQGGRGGKPGAFRASITQHTTTRTGSVKLEFGSPLFYTKYIVGGTRPHVIVPRNARVLHFRTDSGANVFARSVNHPGTRANHFVSRAVAPLLPVLQESFSTVMHEAFGGTP
jgi:hypothetical protein